MTKEFDITCRKCGSINIEFDLRIEQVILLCKNCGNDECIDFFKYN